MTHSVPDSETALRTAYHEYIGKYGTSRAVTAMANDYGCTPATVYRHLAAAGIRAHREKVERPAEAHLRELYEAVVSVHGARAATGKLAAEFGVTQVTIRDWMATYRIRARKPLSGMREPITEPCPCGAVATTRYRGQDPPLCPRCYMRTWAASEDSNFRRRGREYVQDVKRDTPCADCGGRFPPCCMHFDHVPERGQKLFDIGRSDFGIAKIQAEIAKCDLVCANCHAIRTWNRNHPEAPVSLEPVPGASETAVPAVVLV